MPVSVSNIMSVINTLHEVSHDNQTAEINIAYLYLENQLHGRYPAEADKAFEFSLSLVFFARAENALYYYDHTPTRPFGIEVEVTFPHCADSNIAREALYVLESVHNLTHAAINRHFGNSIDLPMGMALVAIYVWGVGLEYAAEMAIACEVENAQSLPQRLKSGQVRRGVPLDPNAWQGHPRLIRRAAHALFGQLID